jgi:hypothetical protein
VVAIRNEALKEEEHAMIAMRLNLYASNPRLLPLTT